MAQKVRIGLLTYNGQVKKHLESKHERPTLTAMEADIVISAYGRGMTAEGAGDMIIEARQKETE